MEYSLEETLKKLELANQTAQELIESLNHQIDGLLEAVEQLRGIQESEERPEPVGLII